jgi:predicted transcriptional regulator
VKQKPLIKVLFESETTINSLVFLKDYPGTEEQLSTHLKIPAKELLSCMAELQEYYLIIKDDDNKYKLTVIGKLLTDNITRLLTALDKIEEAGSDDN